MRLRRKTAIVIVVVTVVVFSSISGITTTLLMAKFAQLEKQNVDQNVQRTVNALSDDLTTLERTDNEWASSDATYQFAQNPQQGQAYIQSNLLDSDLINLRISLVVYFDRTGNVAYSKALDSNNIGIQVPQQTLAAIEANTELWNHKTLYSDISGILSLPKGLLMVASDPILTSESLGPIMGALVMGRYVNDAEVAYLSNMLRLPLSIQTLTNSQMPTDFQRALSLISGNDTSCVQPLAANLIGGYATMNGFSGSPVLILRVELPRDIYNQGQEDTFYVSLTLGLVCIVFGSAIMLLMEKVVLIPLAGLDSEVKSIQQDPKGSRRLRVAGNDELASLGTSVNQMLSGLEQSQRLAAVGELTTVIANDLRNPLQGINAAAYYLRTKMTSKDEKTAKMLALIEKDINYSDRIIRQLLEYSEPMCPEVRDTTSQEILNGALSLVKVPEKIQVMNETQNDLKMRVDKQKITAVFRHLIENAVDAMPEGGMLRIESMSLNSDVIFKFSDTGVGMSQELLKKIWNPLFTTKAKGMGLSLATCKRIVEAHGGSISVQSTVGKGSTFTVVIRAREKDVPKSSHLKE